MRIVNPAELNDVLARVSSGFPSSIRINLDDAT